MELSNEFSVGVPVDEAWAVLTDLERVAPCMPGFQLQEIEGDEYRGVVKVKVGPMTAEYKGVASFRERDEVNHRAVVRAEGRETRGQGNASATVTATLESEDGGTRVTLHTDLTITGKVAQFGRGMLVEVSSKLLGQFVRALEADVLRGAASASSAASGRAAVAEPSDGRSGEARGKVRDEPPPESRTISAPPSEPVDLLATAGSSLLKRVVPILVALAVVLWLVRRC